MTASIATSQPSTERVMVAAAAHADGSGRCAAGPDHSEAPGPTICTALDPRDRECVTASVFTAEPWGRAPRDLMDPLVWVA